MGGVASVVTIASGVNSLTGGAITDALGIGGGGGSAGGGSYSSPSGAQAAADPYAAYRSQAAADYSAALKGGVTDVTKMPGYTAFQTGVMDPALQATRRTAAASGQNISGATLASLQGVGEQGYYGFMTDYLNRLSTASGATNNPYSAAALGANVNAANQQGVAQGLGALATGLKGFSTNTAINTGGYTEGWTGTALDRSYSATQYAGLANTGDFGLVW
jgi:hypothetical protein